MNMKRFSLHRPADSKIKLPCQTKIGVPHM